MLRLICLVIVFAAFCAAQTDPGPFFSNMRGGTLRLPFEVTTRDGVRLPAGDYTVSTLKNWFVHVGRPSASMGAWPGPTFRLTPDQQTVEGPRFYSLRTQYEVRVVYDLPNDWSERQRVRQFGNRVLPLIRNGRVLDAIVYDGITYYITGGQPIERRRAPSTTVRP